MAVWTTPDAVHSKCGETDPFFATNAIDENIDSAWRHFLVGYHWIIFDMGATKTITKIRIYQSPILSEWRWGSNVGFYVYVGDNPEDLGDAVWEGILDTGGWQESGAFNKNGRYVKLVTKFGRDSERIFEFDAYVVKRVLFRGLFAGVFG